MRIAIAIDSFKGTMSSLQAGEAVREAILEVDPAAEVSVRPLADGGEGTVDTFLAGIAGAKPVTVSVSGPLSEPVEAKYCILEGGTAVLEMSAAAGLPLVPKGKRDPGKTTTFGVGEMIRDAIGRGCRHFLVGIGGSATNDGGTGMLRALGYAFLDQDGKPIAPGAEGLRSLSEIRTENVIPELADCSFRIACDVTNPLCGEKGCSAVYGPQKGATPESIPLMDAWLAHYADLAKAVSERADPNHPGAGAAGGMGFAFLAFTNAALDSGIQIVLEETRLEDYIKKADIVVTGEGKMDGQSMMGKAPIGVATLAKKHGKKVIAFAGAVTDDTVRVNDYGIDAYFSTTPDALPLEIILNPPYARQCLKDTARQAFRLLLL